MKVKILILLLLGCVGAWGQENDIKRGGNYYFNYLPSSAINQIENDAKSFDSNLKKGIIAILEGTSYNIKVTKIEDDKVYFVFGEFEVSHIEQIINKHGLGFDDYGAYKENDSQNLPGNLLTDKKYVYSLPLDVFQENTLPLYNRVEYRVGAYTIPFKLRTSSFSFDANVNLGANLGAKIRWNRKIKDGFVLEPIIGFGLASIKLDEANSNTTESTNVSAFTINTGVLIHITNSINVGFTYGFDNIGQNDQNNYKWKYQGKGWLGLGINISFSNQNSNTGNERTN